METWYKVIKDENYCKSFLEIFCDLHDYRITNINYDFAQNRIDVYFEYDSREEGAILRFINPLSLNINTDVDYETDWLSGCTVRILKNGSFLWYACDEEIADEELSKFKVHWIKAEQIRFAYVNKNHEIEELPRDMLDCIWNELDWKTGKYKKISKHFGVYKVEEKTDCEDGFRSSCDKIKSS